ncbi:MAG: hypothetical protein UZ22_OP11002000919 [Microgenomates bacterium OLB23]|nr:MAG: hypothetical protein UZ22_OP11002000919 [Microgenomates bacterium OLB23]
MKADISIGFASNLVPLILDGSKTLTYRIGDKYDFLQVGDEVDMRDSSNDKVFSKVKIVEKDYTIFKDLPTDKVGHEVYSSKEEQRATFEKYYGEVKDDDKILILGFTVIEKY